MKPTELERLMREGTFASYVPVPVISLEQIMADLAEFADYRPQPRCRVVVSRFVRPGFYPLGDGTWVTDADSFETLRTQLAFDAWMAREGES